MKAARFTRGRWKPSRQMVAKIIVQRSTSTPSVAGPKARAATLGPRFTSQPINTLSAIATIVRYGSAAIDPLSGG